jgi:hypothetical protein
MKKTIGTLALALGLSLIPGCARQKTSTKLEQRIPGQEIFDFNKSETEMIASAIALVKRDYELPDIVVIRDKTRDRYALPGERLNGEYCGLCVNHKNRLPGYFNYSKFGNHHLIFLRGQEEYLDLKKEKWDENVSHPLISTTIHETGHLFFSLLPEKEKQEVLRRFTEIDLSLAENVPGRPHPGHPSHHSYRYRIRQGMKPEEIRKAIEEQWVEIFVYKVLECRHQNSDLKFCLKAMEVGDDAQIFGR